MNDDTVLVGRLAFRLEGRMWNVYWAQPGTMEGALHIASVMAVMVPDDASKMRFVETVRDLFSPIMSAVAGGAEVIFPDKPQAAPEHERGGNA
jgi:hypothetical protein